MNESIQKVPYLDLVPRSLVFLLQCLSSEVSLVLASQITAVLKCQCILCVCSLSSPVVSLRHSFFDLCSSLTAERIWVTVVLSKALCEPPTHQTSYYKLCQKHLIHLSLISYDTEMMCFKVTKLYHCFLLE